MIDPVTTSTTAVTGAAAAQKSLASNFDTFLTLLTTQLQHQDPLSPMDSTEFTQQLVQFSSVEQQISANKNLESLIALTKSRSSADAVSYLGKSLTTTDGSASSRADHSGTANTGRHPCFGNKPDADQSRFSDRADQCRATTPNRSAGAYCGYAGRSTRFGSAGRSHRAPFRGG